MDTLQGEIKFDTADYYVAIILIMPVIHFVQYVINRHKQSRIAKNSGKVIIATFILLLVLINGIIFFIKDRLDKKGYEACTKIKSLSVGVRGEGWLYRLGGCKNKEGGENIPVTPPIL